MKPKLAALVLLAGCGLPLLPPHSLQLVERVKVGAPVAVAELDGRVLILEADRATVLRAGVATAIPGTHRWHSAATLPAADGVGSWLVAIDDAGLIYRLHDGAFEAIADRYRLGRIHAACSPRAGVSAFLLDDTVAVADGTQITRWPLGLGDLACGGNRVAGRVAGPRREIAVLDLGAATQIRYPLDAVAVALDDRGQLYAASRDALYVEHEGVLTRRYLARTQLGDLAAAGTQLWLTDGNTLVSLDHDQLTASPTDGSPRLQATARGEIWLLHDHPTHLAHRDLPRDAWADLVAPVFTRACASCHLPSGRAGVDLSTAPAWHTRRALLRQRLLVDRDMPPKGHPLSDADRATLATWIATPN